MQRIGIYGGSFDPVHLGHLLVAKAALEELALDRLYFVPAAQSPFKATLPRAGAALRLRMLRSALAGRERYEVDAQEIQRSVPSYSIDTVHGFRSRFPGARLFYLIGADHLNQLERWKDAVRLAAWAEFVVIPRPGVDGTAAANHFRCHRLRGFPIQISSSEIRRRIRDRLSIRDLVPETVEEVVRRERMYQSSNTSSGEGG